MTSLARRLAGGSMSATAGLVTLGALAVAVAARVSFALPGTEVPQTGQTLAVLLGGALLGPARGAAAMLLYLVLGMAGAPVFANGASGYASLAGPTGGYLLGFLPAAALAGLGAGWLNGARRPRRGWACLGLALLAAHAVILLCGWSRLAVEIGAARAFDAGVAPFLAGAAGKSLLAALLALAWFRLGPPRSPA